VSEDWYVESIDNVQRCADALHDALDQAVGALLIAREERIAGLPLPEMVARLVERGGTSARRSADEAFRAYTEAVTAYRAKVIRALVDEEGLTLSEIARSTGVSRQMVGRLYRAASG
jgi:hypothetical protein